MTIYRLLDNIIENVHMKFEIEIPERAKVYIWADEQTDKVNPVYSPPTSWDGIIIIMLHTSQ